MTPPSAPPSPAALPPGFHARYGELLDHFGHHVTTHYFNSAEHSVTAVLYEAVVMRFFIGATGELSAVRLLESGEAEPVGAQHSLTEAADPYGTTSADSHPVGTDGSASIVSTVSTASSTAGSDGTASTRSTELYATVDAHCRARLPAAFLARVDVLVDCDTAFYGERSGRPPAPTVPMDDLRDLIETYFGTRITQAVRVAHSRMISCVLYNTFDLTFGYDERMSTFHAAVTLGAGHVSQKFLGRSVSMNSDRQTILQSLALVDEYCHLRLARPLG